AAEALDGEGDHALDLVGLADVGREEFGRPAGLANLFDDAVAAFFVDVDDDNRCPFARESLGRRLADARATAGDECDLVLEPHGGSLPLVFAAPRTASIRRHPGGASSCRACRGGSTCAALKAGPPRAAPAPGG